MYWKLRNDKDKDPLKPPPTPCVVPGLFPDPFNNASFYECKNDTLIIGNHTCPDGFHFNHDAEDVEEACEFTCPGVGIFPHPTDENSYFNCTDDKGTLKPEKVECPEDSHFDEKQKLCTSVPYKLVGLASRRCITQNAATNTYEIVNCGKEDSQNFTLITPVSVFAHCDNLARPLT